jgi:hypothetical protein
MKGWIECNTLDGRKCFINVNTICYILPMKPITENTLVGFSDNDCFKQVKESYEEVKNLIAEALK